MLWFGLRSYIAALERRLATLEQDKECSKNNHIWETVTRTYSNEPPFIRCKHCWKQPKQERGA